MSDNNSERQVFGTYQSETFY